MSSIEMLALGQIDIQDQETSLLESGVMSPYIQLVECLNPKYKYLVIEYGKNNPSNEIQDRFNNLAFKMVYDGYLDHNIFKETYPLDDFIKSQQFLMKDADIIRHYLLIKNGDYVATVTKYTSDPEKKIWEVGALTNRADKSSLLTLEMIKVLYQEALNNDQIFEGSMFKPTFEVLNFILSDIFKRTGEDIHINQLISELNQNCDSDSLLVPFKYEVDKTLENVTGSIKRLISEIFNLRPDELLFNPFLEEQFQTIKNNTELRRIDKRVKQLFMQIRFLIEFNDNLPEDKIHQHDRDLINFFKAIFQS